MKRYNFADEPQILKRVTVRLLRDDERARFDELLEQKHYLCSDQMVGRTLRYVAELDGEWVALALLQRGGIASKSA